MPQKSEKQNKNLVVQKKGYSGNVKYYSTYRKQQKVYPKHGFSPAMLGLLRTRCQQNTNTFLRQYPTHIGHDGEYIFIDRGAKVLAVAHMDTVWDHGIGTDLQPNLKRTPSQIAKVYQHDKSAGIIHSPSLDDRAGVWMIMDILPSLVGFEFDVLLTRDEEIGSSTAQNALPHLPKDRYNWMFEWDRAGVDVPMYQYTNNDSENLLEEYDFESGYGSFTDICDLEGLEVMGFNFGTAYESAHRSDHYLDLNALWSQVSKFVKFFNEQKGTYMPYDPSTSTGVNSHSSYGVYDKYGWDDWGYYGSNANTPGKKEISPNADTCDLCTSKSTIHTGNGNFCYTCWMKYEQDNVTYLDEYEDDVPRLPAAILDRLRNPDDIVNLIGYCDICYDEFLELDLEEIPTNTENTPVFLCESCYAESKYGLQEQFIYNCRTCNREVINLSETDPNQAQCPNCFRNYNLDKGTN